MAICALLDCFKGISPRAKIEGTRDYRSKADYSPCSNCIHVLVHNKEGGASRPTISSITSKIIALHVQLTSSIRSTQFRLAGEGSSQEPQDQAAGAFEGLPSASVQLSACSLVSWGRNPEILTARWYPGLAAISPIHRTIFGYGDRSTGLQYLPVISV